MTDPTSTLPRTIARAAVAAVEGGKSHVKLVRPLELERLQMLEGRALNAQRNGVLVATEPADLLLMIDEIREGRKAR